MNNSVLNDLLKQYEKIRIKNTYELENRKKELSLSNPKLQEIDDKLNSISINTAKLILQNNEGIYKLFISLGSLIYLYFKRLL